MKMMLVFAISALVSVALPGALFAAEEIGQAPSPETPDHAFFRELAKDDQLVVRGRATAIHRTYDSLGHFLLALGYPEDVVDDGFFQSYSPKLVRVEGQTSVGWFELDTILCWFTVGTEPGEPCSSLDASDRWFLLEPITLDADARVKTIQAYVLRDYSEPIKSRGRR